MRSIFKLSIYLVLLFGLAACGGGDSDDGGDGGGSDNDIDNDGVLDAVDIDDDNDGLIEIATLEELDWIRNDPSGQTLDDGQGNVMIMGCPDVVCIGYELIADLDFDTNDDDAIDADDTFYNDGEGWQPIGTGDEPFAAIFDGNGFSISNLFIDRPVIDGVEVGLFGAVMGDPSQPVEIRNIVLGGDLMDVTGGTSAGGLVGFAVGNVTISNVSVGGNVVGNTGTGGLVGAALAGVTIIGSNVTGDVTGVLNTGGLVGFTIDSIISESSASGNVTGDIIATGGLVGSAQGAAISDTFATGSVSGEAGVGGLIGLAAASNVSFSFSANSVNGNMDVEAVGAFVGLSADTTYQANHFASGSNMLMAVGEVDGENVGIDDITGDTLLNLQAQTAPGQAEGELFFGWDDAIWDFGDDTELPQLINVGPSP